MTYWIVPGLKNFDIKQHLVESQEGNIKLLYKEKPNSLLQSVLERSYLNYVIAICEEIFEVENIFDRQRTRKYTEARFSCWYILRTILHMSTTKVGLKFGRDHSTIVHGRRQHENLIQYEEDYKYKHLNAKRLIIDKMIRDEKSYYKYFRD